LRFEGETKEDLEAIEKEVKKTLEKVIKKLGNS
jgi:putative transposon-encoded protein